MTDAEGELLTGPVSPRDEKFATAIEALRTLGFAQNEVREMISKLKKSGLLEDEELTEEKIIRLALKELKRH